MTKRVKAVLLSALIFPDLGQLFLKKYVSAAVIGGAALAGRSFLMEETMQQALQITAQIQIGAVPADIATISELISEQASGGAAQGANIALVVLLILWLIGIVDARRAGGARDRKDADS